MIGKEYFMQRKTPIILVILLLIAGSIVYFATSVSKNVEAMKSQDIIKVDSSTLNMLRSVQLKAAYTEEGNIDIFALAKNNDLAKIKTTIGNSIPENGGLVIGNIEGSMMFEENEFKNVGDTIEDYNIQPRVDGVLTKTGTFADDFHFLSSDLYNKLEGDSGVLLVKFKDENTPKLFYLYDRDESSPAKIELVDGNINLFYKHIIDKKIYYPIIIGAKEAEMMQEEKLFKKTGDVIIDFFDKNVIVVGIAKETNTGLDMMHVVEKDFFDESVRGVLV